MVPKKKDHLTQYSLQVLTVWFDLTRWQKAAALLKKSTWATFRTLQQNPIIECKKQTERNVTFFCYPHSFELMFYSSRDNTVWDLMSGISICNICGTDGAVRRLISAGISYEIHVCGGEITADLCAAWCMAAVRSEPQKSTDEQSGSSVIIHPNSQHLTPPPSIAHTQLIERFMNSD